MPELPEVEREARLLDAAARGARVEEVVVTDARVLRGVDVEGFVAALRGRVVVGATREGKHLFVTLADGASRGASCGDEGLRETLLWTHLRMTGRFVVTAREAPLPPHTRYALGLERASPRLRRRAPLRDGERGAAGGGAHARGRRRARS